MCQPTRKIAGASSSPSSSDEGGAASSPSRQPAGLLTSVTAPLTTRTTRPPAATAMSSSSSISSESESSVKRPDHPCSSPQLVLREGTRWATASLGLLFVAYSLTMPHQQSRRDVLGCDALCLGTITSARSFLKLLGSVLVGRISDARTSHQHGAANDGDGSLLARLRRNARYSARKLCLGIGVAAAGGALLAARRAESVTGLWWSLVPEAFEQNMHVSKALLGEYQNLPDITSADRASSSGSLGSAVGVAMMVGPLLGSYMTYDQAVALAVVFLFISFGSIVALPVVPAIPSSTTSSKANPATDPLSGVSSAKPPVRWWRIMDVPSARSPPALFMLACRLLSTTAYHIYQTMLTVSLRERFNFTPMEYGKFFSCIGLFFALSQTVMAKFFLKRMAPGPDAARSHTLFSRDQQNRGRVRLLVACSILITITRYVGYRTRSVLAVYGVFAVMVSAYGIMSTLIAADTAQIAAPNELGSFFGLLAAVESGAGMVGPLVGGALNSLVRHGSDGDDPGPATSLSASLWAVIFLNLLGTAMLALGYERIVLSHINRSTSDQSLKGKRE